MSEVSILVTPARIKRLGENVLDLRLRKSLGWTLKELSGNSTYFDLDHPFICRALARELLLWSVLDRPFPDKLGSDQRILSCHPIRDEQAPCMEKLLELGCMPALFPLDRGDADPGLGIVWIGRDGKPWIDYPGQITGNSWHLAASLAKRALALGTSAERERLACGYIASGVVDDGGKVMPVKEGAKSSLNLAGRQWLVPQAGWSGKNDHIPIRSVSDAWAIVADSAALDLGCSRAGQKREYPTTLHSFAGESVLPLLQVILAQKPKKVVIWESSWEPSRLCARFVREFFELSLPATFAGYRPEFEMHPILSDNLATIEVLLGEYFKQGDSRERVAFNITNGNIVQRLGAHNMMRLRRSTNGSLVYRDIDTKEPGELGEIRFPPGRDHPSWQLVRAESEFRETFPVAAVWNQKLTALTTTPQSLLHLLTTPSATQKS